MTSRSIRPGLLLLFVLLLSSCSRGSYLFISDHYFAALEGESLDAELGGKVEIEAFSSPPEAARVLELLSGRRPKGLLFSPLYYGLAAAVARLEPGVPLYAVLPPGHEAQDNLKAAVFNLAGAGRLILEAAAQAFPAEGPESVLLIYSDTGPGGGWTFIEKELRVRFASGSIESHTLPPGLDSEAQLLSFTERTLQRTEYDLLLILAGRLTPGLTQALASGSPEAVFLTDHPPQQDSGLEGGYLVYRWARLYSALLEGETGADAWEFRPFRARSAP